MPTNGAAAATTKNTIPKTPRRPLPNDVCALSSGADCRFDIFLLDEMGRGVPDVEREDSPFISVRQALWHYSVQQREIVTIRIQTINVCALNYSYDRIPAPFYTFG
jgi:hypothetical protein